MSVVLLCVSLWIAFFAGYFSDEEEKIFSIVRLVEGIGAVISVSFFGAFVYITIMMIGGKFA